MTELRQRMNQDMQLRGYSPATQNSYREAVIDLVKYFRISPDRITDEQLREYFLHLINERKVSESTFRVRLYGIKFFYTVTLGRAFPVLDLVRPRKRKKLPVVLSLEEIVVILSHIRDPRIRMCLHVMYACGLRISEAVALEVRDVNKFRKTVMIRDAKGGRDRCVPIAQATLDALREYWLPERPEPLIFPGKDGRSQIDHSVVQRAFRNALRASCIRKDASPHTLRHSYATHLLEQGIPMTLVQRILGHRNLLTTAIYAHLTQAGADRFRATLEQLMKRL
jgi:site-specific recombinase XerD